MNTEFIEDDQVYETSKDKNKRLADLLMVDMAYENIISIARNEEPNKGWTFTMAET